MKKIILVVCLSFFAFSQMSAQDLKFGVKGGLNLATLGGDDLGGLSSFDSKTSFHVGLFAEVPLMLKFSIQPELLYSTQGFKGDNSLLGAIVSFDQKIDYLTAPIMVKYKLIQGLSVEAGPVIGYLISAKYETVFNDVETKIENKDSFNDLDFGVGIGTSYALSNGLMAGVRYTLGLSNVNNSEFSSGSNQNNVFQLWAGYSFL